jgi:hypothetical protein
MRFISLSLLCVSVLAACAGTPTMSSLPADKGHDVSTALAGGVGELQIDAGSFDISPEAKADLLGGFHGEMAKIGVPVTPTGTPVILHVSEFKARSTAARIILGVLAGSDHIKGTVSVAGTEFEVADSGVTVVTGIGTVARDVGVQTADGIRRLAGVTAK